MLTLLLIPINLERIMQGSLEFLYRSMTMPLFKLGQESVTLLWLIQVFGLLIIVSLLARSLKRFLKNFLLLKLKINKQKKALFLRNALLIKAYYLSVLSIINPRHENCYPCWSKTSIY